MSTYSATLGASGSWELRAVGRFFRLLEASAAVTVVFYRDGREIAQADDMLAGYAETLEEAAFDRVRVEGTPGTVFKLAVRKSGRVEYDRGAANVDVATLPDITVAPGEVIGVDSLPDNPLLIGAQKSAAFVVPAGVTALVNPATNTGGLILRTATLAAGTVWGSLLAKSSAPSGWSDTTANVLAVVTSGGAANLKDIELPAGVGVYVGASGASYVTAAITFDLL